MYKDSFVLPATDAPDKWVRKVSIWISIASKAFPTVAIISLSSMLSIRRIGVQDNHKNCKIPYSEQGSGEYVPPSSK